MRDRVCLVTGATSGIGRATALALAWMGARVIVVSRERTRGEATVAALGKAGGAGAELVVADLSSQAEIARLVTEVRGRHERLHVLINNAAAVHTERRLTVDGIEATLALNHLAYVLVTQGLLDVLKAGAPSRIVNVTSEAHRAVRLDFDDLQSARNYRGVRAYSLSKLMNILWTYELARRLAGTGVTVNCVHPGVIDTGIWRDSRGLLRAIVALMRPFMRAPEQGAAAVVQAAADPGLEGTSGRYFVKLKEARSSAVTYDTEAAARLWRASAELTPLRA
jgi:NAD(P)-dependent dehydrogenase (short-subunit alcohol dehydrogenase family)